MSGHFCCNLQFIDSSLSGFAVASWFAMSSRISNAAHRACSLLGMTAIQSFLYFKQYRDTWPIRYLVTSVMCVLLGSQSCPRFDACSRCLDFASSAFSAHIIFFYLASSSLLQLFNLLTSFAAGELWKSIYNFATVRSPMLFLPSHERLTI